MRPEVIFTPEKLIQTLLMPLLYKLPTAFHRYLTVMFRYKRGLCGPTFQLLLKTENSGLPTVIALVIAIIVPKVQSFWKVSHFLLIPFILLEGLKVHYSGTYSLAFTPKTTSNFNDRDQMISFVTTVAVVFYQ
jgi:hypothetical protein